jgi:hypothetical protein
MRRVGGVLGNERGSTLVMMAVMLFGMLALAALAIDLASLRDARSEAQRAADAIALAGATAFYNLPAGEPAPTSCGDTCLEAHERALLIARQNMVRSDTIYVNDSVVTDIPNAYPGGGFVRTIEAAHLTINIIPAVDSQKVRVWVRHPGVATFFGGMLAKPYGHVQAMATAWANNAAPIVNCLKPFLIPDMWHESDKATQDVNTNDYMEPGATAHGNQTTGGEQWFYQPPALGGTDYYEPYNPNVTPDPLRPQTGYGSGRMGYSGDVGVPMLLKPQTGNNQRQGNSYFTLDGDEANLREDIKQGCINAAVGETPNWSQGSATGQAKQGINWLISQDPGAVWNPSTKQIDNSAYPDWTQSPRVIIVGLMDPIYIKGNSTNVKPDPGAEFNNFARLFLEDSPGNTDNIQGIFLGYAPGGTGGTTAGSLVRRLQLIE